MAASIAAGIKSDLGLTAQLIEGHNAIFLVTADGQILYDNNGVCGRLPETGDILNSIKACQNSIPSEEVKAPAADTQTSCCAPQAAQSLTIEPEKRHLDIEFLFLDLEVCEPCRGTESSLEEALAEVARVLEATGIEVSVQKTHVQSAEQALAMGFVSSPTIRINGRDIQLEVRESLCPSCGDLCGGEVDCRVWVYQGKEYPVPPKGLIIEAILREVYKEPGKNYAEQPRPSELPENLKKFFAAKRKKEGK